MLINDDNTKNSARISQFSMKIFYKYIYLIINTLMNIVIRDYWKISSSECSDRIEASNLLASVQSGFLEKYIFDQYIVQKFCCC